MSSDEYIEVELDVEASNASSSNQVHIISVENEVVNGDGKKSSYEVIDASSFCNNWATPSSDVFAKNADGRCMICDASANGIHFKVVSCAACNAFFRRSVAERRKYICRESGDCEISHKSRCLCRACRLKKCLKMGMDPTSVQPQRDAIGSKRRAKAGNTTMVKKGNKKAREALPQKDPELPVESTSNERPNKLPVEDSGNSSYSGSVESTERFYETGSNSQPIVIEWSPDTNLIEEVLCAYQQLQERRRLMYCPRTLKDLLSGTMPEFKKETNYFTKESMRGESVIIVDFFKNIQPFTFLDLESQIALVRAFSLPMTIIEKYYMTYRQGGHLNNTIYHQNYTYVSIEDAETNLDATNTVPLNNLPISSSQPINTQTILQINIPYMKKAINDIVLPMAAVDMTEVEIVGLMLIMMFDPYTDGLSDTAKGIVKAVRDRVYDDWFAIYSHNGISNGAEKVGNVILITSAISEFAQLITQNFHFVRVFGLADYDELLNDVFLNKPVKSV